MKANKLPQCDLYASPGLQPRTAVVYQLVQDFSMPNVLTTDMTLSLKWKNEYTQEKAVSLDGARRLTNT